MELVNDFKEITEKVDLRPCEQFFTAMSITNHNFMRKITLVNDELHDYRKEEQS